MSTSRLPSCRPDPHRAEVCGKIFGEHIRHFRLQSGRPLEELAPQAGLTVAEWEAIEGGEIPVYEQLLVFAMVFHLGRSWVSYLARLSDVALRK